MMIGRYPEEPFKILRPFIRVTRGRIYARA